MVSLLYKNVCLCLIDRRIFINYKEPGSDGEHEPDENCIKKRYRTQSEIHYTLLMISRSISHMYV